MAQTSIPDCFFCGHRLNIASPSSFFCPACGMAEFGQTDGVQQQQQQQPQQDKKKE
jgi:predicted RNA-binding Zn-ribbon protein involved in translation (DUF1610 family)